MQETLCVVVLVGVGVCQSCPCSQLVSATSNSMGAVVDCVSHKPGEPVCPQYQETWCAGVPTLSYYVTAHRDLGPLAGERCVLISHVSVSSIHHTAPHTETISLSS